MDSKHGLGQGSYVRRVRDYLLGSWGHSQMTSLLWEKRLLCIIDRTMSSWHYFSVGRSAYVNLKA